MPVEDPSMSTYVWLGLASAFYFQGRTNDEIQPMWSGPSMSSVRVIGVGNS